MLRKFFFPKSVAVAGASSSPEKIGHIILKNLVDEFSGEIYPVNPKGGEILGLKAYETIKRIKKPVDLAIIAVPPSVSNHVAKECVERKIPAVIMITAGYRETGAEGTTREEELKRIIKGSGTRLIGPNCLGVFDPYGKIDTLFLPEYKLKRPGKGCLALLSQSGAFGSAVLDWAATEEVGISRFISYGNRADVSGVDLLKYLAKDKQTKAILWYIEGPKNGRVLLETLKKVTPKKPVVIFKAGKSEQGSRAAVSHTGSLAGSYDVFSAAIKQGGAVEAKTVEEIFDFGRILAYQSRPKGKRIGIITNGGGFGVVSADACIEERLKVAEFSKETKDAARKALPDYATVHNPLDLIGDADAERYETALNAFLKDPNIDAIMAVVLLQTVTLEPDVIDVLSAINEKKKKPLVVCSAGGEYTHLLLRSLEKEGIPSYPSPARAMRAMRVLVEHGIEKR